MFQFLNELLTVRESALLEDLGKLKDLGLGRLINAYKQQYYLVGRTRKDERVSTSAVGNKLNHYSRIGQDSESVNVGTVTKWSQVKKAIKANERDVIGAIFTIDGKAAVLLIGDSVQLTYSRAAVGIAWDFTGISGVDEGKLLDVLGSLENKTAKVPSYADNVAVHSHPLKSSHTTEHSTLNAPDLIVRHFEGVGQKMADVPAFFDKLLSLFGSRVHLKLILSDKIANVRRAARRDNPEIKPEDVTLFQDSLKTRLAKYKNSKVQSVDDMREFVEKVFTGGVKKINFAGRTYSAIPDDSSESTFKNLLSGKTSTMRFEADRSAGQYDTLYLEVAFKHGQIVPVSVQYYDADHKETMSEKF